MKKFILKFKQLISYIFSLKSKPLTILLGTLVPFFAVHILAYAIKESKGGKYRNNFYLPFFWFLSLYFAEIVGFVVFFHTSDILFDIILLVMYFLANYSVTIMFWVIIANKRKELLSHQN